MINDELNGGIRPRFWGSAQNRFQRVAEKTFNIKQEYDTSAQ